jgi:hypothetical protein
VVQGEVLVEAAQHHREVLLLLASLPMSVSKQPLAGASEELSATLGAGDPDQGEPPCSILPTDVLEAQKLKRLWPLSVLAPFDGGKTPKEQQPSFLLGQFQIELRKTFPQLARTGNLSSGVVMVNSAKDRCVLKLLYNEI